jgi:hypothetical protein
MPCTNQDQCNDANLLLICGGATLTACDASLQASVAIRERCPPQQRSHPLPGGLQNRQWTFTRAGALLTHTQHHDRPSYALMAFCQSIITVVARLRIDRRLGILRPTK